MYVLLYLQQVFSTKRFVIDNGKEDRTNLTEIACGNLEYRKWQSD